MATLTSQEILNATVSMGHSKANQCWIARAANTLLAGMYIAIGGFLAIRIGLALPWEQWGGMSKLIFGAVFRSAGNREVDPFPTVDRTVSGVYGHK